MCDLKCLDLSRVANFFFIECHIYFEPLVSLQVFTFNLHSSLLHLFFKFLADSASSIVFSVVRVIAPTRFMNSSHVYEQTASCSVSHRLKYRHSEELVLQRTFTLEKRWIGELRRIGTTKVDQTVTETRCLKSVTVLLNFEYRNAKLLNSEILLNIEKDGFAIDFCMKCSKIKKQFLVELNLNSQFYFL